tara:strand:- start:407 stop:808 length:402 start_codon:yes stop_codon:yes gene_type:complete
MTGGIVMVLGNTGVNFAAGMSGGIAYVYDESDSFESKCNLSMVEILKINRSENQGFDNIFDKYSLLTNDEVRIKEMLKRHINYTNSLKAKSILDDFENNFKKFYKVLPIDFKNALLKSSNLDNIISGVKQWQK